MIDLYPDVPNYTPPEAARILAPLGVEITTGASSVSAAIPNKTDGQRPGRVRVTCSAAAYFRFGKSTEQSAVAAAAGTGYVINELITLAGGTYVSPMVLKATHLKVVSATIDVAGTGGTNGSQTVTGTTGTGTKFQATVTVAGGVITSVDAIAVAGDYTADMTARTHEPVTGASLVGAQLNCVMGVLTVTVSDSGTYSADPANPVAQASTSGAGTGATFTVTQTTAAATTDPVIYPGPGEILSSAGFSHFAAIQVSGAGKFQVRAIDD